MIVAISASLAPARASRVTTVPHKSLKVTPAIPATLHAFRQLERKPSAVHGLPSELTRIIGETRARP